MDLSELKLRCLAGLHLLAPSDTQIVLRDLCGVQAQFLSHALHALSIRCTDFLPDMSEGIVKSWTLRGTMHLFCADDLPLMLHRERAHALRPCDTLLADERVTEARKRFFAERIVDAIGEGVCEREALKAVCEAAGMTREEAQSLFDPWGGIIRALCEAGVIVHAVSEKKAYRLCPPFEPMARDAAMQELARRYFLHYGPATVCDAAYFFRWTQADVKRQLDSLPAKTTVCDGKTYYYIEEKPLMQNEMPVCIFLAGFDPLMLGYDKQDNPFLPKEHLRSVFSLSGIVVPTVLLRGRVVGRWKRTGKTLRIVLFEPLGRQGREEIEAQAARAFGSLARILIE